MTCAQAPGPEFRKPKRISFSELRLDLDLDLDLDLKCYKYNLTNKPVHDYKAI